jgi:hypothetical protein
MRGLQTLRAMNRATAIRAAQRQRRPYRIAEDDPHHFSQQPRIRLPHLGFWQPEGYTMTRYFIVDEAGWGTEYEPGYSVAEFSRKLVPGRLYAVTRSARYRVWVAEFVEEGDEPCEEVDLSGRATFSPDRLLAEVDWSRSAWA